MRQRGLNGQPDIAGAAESLSVGGTRYTDAYLHGIFIFNLHILSHIIIKPLVIRRQKSDAGNQSDTTYLFHFFLNLYLHPYLSCLVLSCLVLSCLVLSCLVLSCLVLSCLVLSCPVLSCLILSSLTSTCSSTISLCLRLCYVYIVTERDK